MQKGYICIILKDRVSDQTSKCECNWINLHSLKDLSFNISGCDTQGMKNNIYVTFLAFRSELQHKKISADIFHTR